ncbi:MAG: DEAD/DEAH box helicase [Marinifilaceae bacterium]
MTFTSLGLSEPLLLAVKAKGYETPSPIQARAIPAVLTGKDVLATAQTGTGKTAGFTLPLLQQLEDAPLLKRRPVRALILTPTRELAAQVGESVTDYGKHLPLRSTVVFGGVKINPQIEKLRQGVDILVATPGRLLDLHGQGAVNLSKVEILVLDEADRMLDMGFIHDIKRVLAILPKKRQNLLFSATFSPEIRHLTNSLLRNPIHIDIARRNTAAETVNQKAYKVDRRNKAPLLIHLIKNENWQQVLVFTRTKHRANDLAKKLTRKGINAAAIHGNKSQNARTATLAGFKKGEIRVLVATDIAARGLDIEQLPQVVNFELPNVPEDYVHRIGRTGRAGASGHAVSLVSDEEVKLIKAIEKLLQKAIPNEIMEGFEPGTAPALAPNAKPQQRSANNRPKRKSSTKTSSDDSKPKPKGNWQRRRKKRPIKAA